MATTGDSLLVYKGLSVIGLMLFMAFFASYQLGTASNRNFKVRELLNNDYLLKRESRAAKQQEPLTGSTIEPTTQLETGATPGLSSLETGETGATLPPESLASITPSSVYPESSLFNMSSDESMLDNITNITQQMTTIIPTTTTTLAPCFRQDYQLRNACDLDANLSYVYGQNVTLEDVQDMLFIARVEDRLARVCPSGSWCLRDDWDLRSDMMYFLNFCKLGPCLVSNIPDDCIDDERRLVLSTLLMLCDVANENITDRCFLGIRKLTHVTMVQLKSRKQSQDVCDEDGPKENCTGACQNFAKGLYCMNDGCNQTLEDKFIQYSPWGWYFGMHPEKSYSWCQLNNTDCTPIESASSWLNEIWQNLNNIEYIRAIDGRVVAGIIVAVLFSVAGLGFVVYACIKKGRSLAGFYSRDIVEYQTVDDMEDEYDSS